MARKVTSSSNRNKRGSTKPVTQGQNPQRSNRQAVSNATVSSGSNGKPPASGARVTNAAQRTSTGSARVTGTPRAALPPGTPRPVRASIGNVSGPASSPKPSGTNANLRPGASRTAPSIPKPSTASAKPPVSGVRRFGGGLVSGTLLTAAAGKALETLGRAAQPGEWNRVQRELKDRGYGGNKPVPADTNGRSSRGVRVSDTTNKRDYQSAPTGSQAYNDYRRQQLEAEKARLKNVGNAPIPTAARPSSGGGGRGSNGSGSSRSTSRSSAPARSSTPTAPAKPGQKWSDFNPNRGTSKTNNPLMKDMVGRMKDREDKAQASSASKLTSKFNTNANFSGEKMDGSMYQDSFKKKKKS